MFARLLLAAKYLLVKKWIQINISYNHLLYKKIPNLESFNNNIGIYWKNVLHCKLWSKFRFSNNSSTTIKFIHCNFFWMKTNRCLLSYRVALVKFCFTKYQTKLYKNGIAIAVPFNMLINWLFNLWFCFLYFKTEPVSFRKECCYSTNGAV